MNIFDIPWFNQPRNKILSKGAENLSEAELLAIIFDRGRPGESAIDLGNRLIKTHNLHRLEYLGNQELLNEIRRKRKKPDKEDKIKVAKILALIELAKRYNKLKNEGYKNSISSAKDVYNILVDEYGNKKKEYFICLYLDTKNKVISQKEISIGTLNNSLVQPREVFREAIKESAFSIILAHNHPSGDPKPSEEDIKITKNLAEVGKILGIPILDHIIIGSKNYWSWLESKS